MYGTEIARKKIEWVGNEVLKLKMQGQTVHLAVVLVGNDPASHIYVNHKERASKNANIKSSIFRLPHETLEGDVLGIIEELNEREDIDAILVQLPLPSHIDSNLVIQSIAPEKDVDGLTASNQGCLMLGLDGLIPCTPLGIMGLLNEYHVELRGKQAAVIGRSNLVGAPIAKLLDKAGATVTVIHSKTKNPQEISRQADILVVAAGVRHLVDETWVKNGVVVIDVGIHRTTDGLAGDVNFNKVEPIASKITPVPGGVGPMTIACLLANCLKASKRKYNWK